MSLETLQIRFDADTAGAQSAVRQLGETINNCAQNVDNLSVSFQRAGGNASSGLADGILSGKERVISAARQVAEAAAAALREALQIHSPSRVSYEAGALFGQGFEGGIVSSADAVGSAAKTLGSAASAALAPALPDIKNRKTDGAGSVTDAESITSAVREALDSLHITVPLEVDGYRLGAAAIDGINRVQTALGRTTLKL